jgi:hypothetical protein
MKASALALLGAGALALGAVTPSHAADPAAPPVAQPIVVFVPVPLDFLAPPPLMLDRLFAEQETAITRLIAAMSHLPALPWPALPSAGAPGTNVFMTAVSTTGNGSCSEVITETFGANGKPHVAVRRAGNACAALPDAVAARPAAPPEVRPATQLPLVRVLEVRDQAPLMPSRTRAFGG